ncbi:AbiV family abortive infection protein [Thiobacillus sp.]|uniref:AbiV family abortive infection protein n=1 Tax=Thiobacillus sp. TaxID=924 RepID=UPI0025E2257E|nr:AbiV family abortive infection protein [Thiobacillus sp.]
MAKDKLPQYRGLLTAGQIATGINAANRNARRLYEDAYFMYEAKRLPSATALAILSIEEAGKPTILRQLALAETDGECKQLWRAYRSHAHKNTAWILGQLVAQGKQRLEDFLPAFDPTSDHPDMLENLKQLCLYTDHYTTGRWSDPAEVDLDFISEYLLKMASVLSNGPTTTEIEIELWIKHMLPVKHEPPDVSKNALKAWYDDMRKLGLTNMSPEYIDSVLEHNQFPT